MAQSKQQSPMKSITKYFTKATQAQLSSRDKSSSRITYIDKRHCRNSAMIVSSETQEDFKTKKIESIIRFINTHKTAT